MMLHNISIVRFTVRLIFFFSASKNNVQVTEYLPLPKATPMSNFSKWKKRNNLKFTWIFLQINSRWVIYFVTLGKLVLNNVHDLCAGQPQQVVYKYTTKGQSRDVYTSLVNLNMLKFVTRSSSITRFSYISWIIYIAYLPIWNVLFSYFYAILLCM